MPTKPIWQRGAAAVLTATLLGVALAWSYDVVRPARQDALVKRQWPMFGGHPSRNQANPFERNLPAKWNDEKGELTHIKWSANLGSKAYGGPAIAGGKIFVGTNNQNPRDSKLVKLNPLGRKVPVDLGVIMCFNEADGKFLWQAVHEKLPGGQVVDWPLEGIASTPTVEGDRFYYVSNRCELVCANVNTGKSIWILGMIAKLGVFPHNLANGSPLVVDDTVYVGTSNGVNEDHLNVPAPQAPSFLAVNKRTGNVLWQNNSPSAALLIAKKDQLGPVERFKQMVNRAELIQHGQWSNPSYAVVKGSPQVIFAGGDGWVYSFAPDGKLIWKFDCNPKDARYALKTGARSDFIATPVIYKEKVYIGVGQDPEHRHGVGHLWCIDMMKKGDVSPELVTDNSVFPPKTKPNPNSALVWHYGGVIDNAAEQQRLRRRYHFGRTMSTCAIHDDLVYAADLSGMVYCLDANNGKVYWDHDTRADIWSSPFYADGKVYLGTDDGVVFVFKHGKDKNLLAENDMGGRIRGPVAALNGVLYVQTENRLHAIATK